MLTSCVLGYGKAVTPARNSMDECFLVLGVALLSPPPPPPPSFLSFFLFTPDDLLVHKTENIEPAVVSSSHHMQAKVYSSL